MNRLRMLWDSLRSSLWFLPTLLVLSAVVLALSLVAAEPWFDGNNLEEKLPRLLGAGAAGARGMLSAIAGSSITVAGVGLSLMLVALTLASSQDTARILRNFMSDKGNQAVLGVFLGVYVYCLVVLRTIRSGDEGAFVPSFAVLVGVVLVRLLAVLHIIAGFTHDEERRHALERHADLLIGTAERSVSSPHDRAAIQSVSQRTLPTSWRVWGKP